MSPTVERKSRASPDRVLDAVVAAWSELKIYFDRRSKELSDEVRNYPTPIARCDEQLTKLIEQRSGAINELKRLLQAVPARSGPPGRRLAALEAYLMLPHACPDDEVEIALRSRLRAAVSGQRGEA
jgi:hypothetical protein